MEEWKEFGEMKEYRVSNLGRVQSRIKYGNQFGVILNNEWKDLRWRFTRRYKGAQGYAYVSIKTKHKVRNEYIHRLVATYFIPNMENKREVNHIDRNILNNCISNLEWVTRKENATHATINNAFDKITKIDEEGAKIVREMYKAGKSSKEISDIMMVSKSAIDRIVGNGARKRFSYLSFGIEAPSNKS